MYLRNLASKYLQSITIFTPFFVNEINIQVAFPLKIIFVILLLFFFWGGGADTTFDKLVWRWD